MKQLRWKDFSLVSKIVIDIIDADDFNFILISLGNLEKTSANTPESISTTFVPS